MRTAFRALSRRIGPGRVFALVLAIAFVALRMANPAPIQAWQLQVFDYYQYFKPRELKRLPVVIVDIDERSLREHGQWPWPRDKIAQLVANIAGYGAAATGFDMVFAEKDRLSPKQLARQMQGLDDDTRKKLEALPGNDEIFALVMKRHRVVLGQSAQQVVAGNDKKPVSRGFAFAGPKPPPNRLVRFPALLRNIDTLEKAATGLGVFVIEQERDGIIRRVPAMVRVGDAILPPLSIELLRAVTGGAAVIVRSNPAGVESINIAGLKVPTDQDGRVWVHFTPHDKRRFISASDILAKKLPKLALRGRLVLIGTSASGLFDLKSTPVSRSVPGVEIHAQMIETILSKSGLSRSFKVVGAEIILTGLISLIIIIITPMMRAVYVLALGMIMAAAIAGTSWYLFVEKKVLMDAAYSLLASFAVFAALVMFNYFREEAQRQQIRGAFSQYLSPALVEQLAAHPEQLELGGETRELTILFCDVRGFTAISELYKDNPQGLTALINRLLTPLSGEVMAHAGTIDKYMGDNIMAFWNAPLSDDDHRKNAVRAALGMLVALKKLNRARIEETGDGEVPPAPLEIGVGINTGTCVVGNIGSNMRFDYSVLGDAVNLASRLEGQTKTYGVHVILGQETAKPLAGAFAILEVDAIRVKGKSEPEVIFALVGDDTMAATDGFVQLASAHTDLLTAYRAQKWGVVEKKIKQCRLSADQIDGLELTGLYDLYADRVKMFKKVPPGKNWDGVFTMQTK